MGSISHYMLGLLVLTILTLTFTSAATSAASGGEALRIRVPVVYQDRMVEDYEYDEFAEHVLRLASLPGCSNPGGFMGRLEYKMLSGDYELLAMFYKYENGYLIVTEHGHFYLEYTGDYTPTPYSQLVGGTLPNAAQRVLEVLADASGSPGIEYSIEARGTIADGGEVYSIVVGGARIWYPVTIQGATGPDCLAASKITGYIPYHATAEYANLTITYRGNATPEPVDLYLAPYGNITMGITLYPYIHVRAGQEEALYRYVPGEGAVETDGPWYYPGDPDWTIIIESSEKTKTVEHGFRFLVVTVFSLIVFLAVMKRLRIWEKLRGG